MLFSPVERDVIPLRYVANYKRGGGRRYTVPMHRVLLQKVLALASAPLIPIKRALGTYHILNGFLIIDPHPLVSLAWAIFSLRSMSRPWAQRVEVGVIGLGSMAMPSWACVTGELLLAEPLPQPGAQGVVFRVDDDAVPHLAVVPAFQLKYTGLDGGRTPCGTGDTGGRYTGGTPARWR